MNALAFLGGAIHLITNPSFVVVALGVGVAAWLALQGQIRIALALLAVAALVSAWLMFQGLQAQITQANAALAHANELRAAAETRADIATAALTASRQFHEVENNLNVALNQGHDEIHEAVNVEETRALFLTFAASDRRLCDAAHGCGAQRA